MAALTSTQSGPLSASSTWGGATFNDGDTATISVTHTVNVDVNKIMGSNASGVGHAVTINGTNSTTFGTFTVDDGVSLTLRGFDRVNNTIFNNKQWGLFLPSPGSTIISDQATDGLSFWNDKGIIHAQLAVQMLSLLQHSIITMLII